MPAPRFQHGFANDVFISYTHEDDHDEAGIRWVSQFEVELRARLAKVSGQSIQTWRDNKLTGADRFGPEIEQQLVDSAVLVSVVTPSYFNSGYCTKERARFIERARANRGLDVGNKARIVKVAKTRVPLAKYPDELRDLLEFRFYVEEPNGTAREFHLSPDAQVQKRFSTVVDDAAQAIEKILRGLETGTTLVAKSFIYLGETSSDIDTYRDRLRRSLVHRGYAVLPEGPLRLHSGPEAEQLVARDLARCGLAVYPVGGYYGPVLEGSGDRSITELQIDMTVRDGRNGSLVRMVWVPPGIDITEERQQGLLERIRRDLPSNGFEVIESPLSEIETHITDRLEGHAPLDEHASIDGDERAEVYLICLPADRDAARVVRDCLHGEGHEVRLPPISEESYATLHTRRLESADAFVVYWGSGDEGWLDPVLADLKRAKGLRKGKPIRSRAVYLADPSTPEKRDFVTHQATVLPGYAPTQVKGVLEPLLAELRGARTRGTA